MNEHPSYLVYQHLGRFLESRGLVPVSEEALGAPRDRFTTELHQIGYFRLDAFSEAAPGGVRRIVTILVVALRGKYTEHGPQLRGLVSSLDSEDFAREGRLAEVIVVVPEAIMRKKNMTDVIRGFRAAPAPAAEEEEEGAGPRIYYNIYPYHVFSLDIPRAQIVPLHEIAPLAEVEAFLMRERLTVDDLKRIAASNPPVVWIGARPGEVVRIVSPSETAGEALGYCLVSRA
jgi:DNA-directed RNA polymerase subunit H (RpoH/RPB5)